jgi:hypothetical protein
MRHRLDVGVLEQVPKHREGAVTRRSARPEGDGHERRLDACEAIDRASERESCGI